VTRDGLIVPEFQQARAEELSMEGMLLAALGLATSGLCGKSIDEIIELFAYIKHADRMHWPIEVAEFVGRFRHQLRTQSQRAQSKKFWDDSTKTAVHLADASFWSRRDKRRYRMSLNDRSKSTISMETVRRAVATINSSLERQGAWRPAYEEMVADILRGFEPPKELAIEDMLRAALRSAKNGLRRNSIDEVNELFHRIKHIERSHWPAELAPFVDRFSLDFSNISVHRGRESEKDVVLQQFL
jgi:hypothetical protein